ncbi:MFS transporter [Streptomyces sp. 5K101]|uniref:MFS transporter n=1 Tax=Streptomyces sp. 5K101 TaxID=3390037 RepID=UPI003975A88B
MRETLALVRNTPGCTLLLFGNFFITLGSSIVVPYLAVYMTGHQGLAPWVAGVAMTVKLWSQFGLMMVGGALADRLGAIEAICLGLSVRVASFLLLAHATSAPGVIVACGLLGLGSALYIPAGKAAIVALLRDPSASAPVFSLRSAANNAGLAVGPLVGSVLLLARPELGLVATAAVFVLLVPAFWRLRRLAPHVPASPQGRQRSRGHIGSFLSLLRHNRRLLWIAGAATAFGFCYVHIEYAMPVLAADHHGPAYAGVLFTVNAVSVVALQVLVSAPMGKVPHTPAVVAGGMLVMGIGFALLGFGSLVLLIIGVVLFSLGEVIIDPRLDSEVAATVDASLRGTAFGLIGVCIALGGSAANLGSSSLAHEGRLGDAYWFVLLAVVAVLAVLAFALFPRRQAAPLAEKTRPLAEAESA